MTISDRQSNFIKCILIALALDFFDIGQLSRPPKLHEVALCKCSLSHCGPVQVSGQLNHTHFLQLRYSKIISCLFELVCDHNYLPFCLLFSPLHLCTPHCIAIAELSLDLLPKSTATLSSSLPPTLKRQTS